MPRQKGLMFINKTSKSKSLSRSTGEEKRQIFSHVQHEAAEDATNAGFRIHTWTAAKNKERSSGAEGGKTRLVRTFNSSWAPSIPRTLEFDPEVLVDLDGLASFYLAKLPEFFQSRFARQMFTSHLAAGSALTHTMGIAMQNNAARSALLCALASTLSLISDRASHEQRSVYLKGVAIHQLRKHVCRDTVQLDSSSLMCAISMLLWTEVLNNAKIGEKLPISGAVGAFGTSNLCSAMLRALPLPPPISPEVYAIQVDIEEYVRYQLDSSSTQTGYGFFEFETAQFVGHELLELAARQKVRFSFREGQRFEGMSPDHPDCQGLAYEAMAVDHQLLSLAQEASASGITSAQDAIRMCLFVVTQPMVGQMGPASALGRSVANQLYDAFDNSDIGSLWAPHFDILLWVLLITAYCSEPGPRWLWLTERTRLLLGILQVGSRDRFEEILQRFIYPKSLFESTVVNIWFDVHNSDAPDDIGCSPQ